MTTFRRKRPAVFRADHPSFPFPLAVKRAPHGTGSTTLQFEALKRVAVALANDERFRVPRAVALDESRGVLLMEWVDLPSLEQRLQDWRTTTSCASQFIADAGQWLSRLHASRHLPDGLVESGRLLEDLLKALREVPDLRRHRTMRRFLRTLGQAAPTVAEISVPSGLQHGDYKPANVLTGRDSTVGIDCHAIHEGPVINDLSHFLNHLDFTFLAPRGARFLPQRRRLNSAFLNGYAGPKPAVERAVPHLPLAWLRLHAVVRFWISDAKANLAFLRFSYRGWCYRRLGRLLDREVAGILAPLSPQPPPR